MKFSDLGLSEPILKNVAAEGYEVPTEIQQQAIPQVLAGCDLFGCAQTGTGKTAAFALPILHRLIATSSAGKRRIRALVLSPTRELASQIDQSFRTYGRGLPLRGAVIYGGVGQHPQVRSLQRGLDVVVATPGRLLDLFNQGHVDLSGVEVFVLDEGDRMLDMGFLPDVRRIISRLPRERQTMLFSATLPDDIRQLSRTIMRNPVTVSVAPISSTAERITQAVYHVSRPNKTTLLRHLLDHSAVSRALVFTRTKRGADRVARDLDKAGIRAAAIHGDKSQAARERALASFRSQHPPVLVATDIAARGIDVDGVSHVFNFDVPHEAETYVHRIGRTARAGASGVAVSLCDGEERSDLKAIERLIGRSIEVRADHPEYPRQAGHASADNSHAKKSPGKPSRKPFGKSSAGGKGRTRRRMSGASRSSGRA